MGGNQLVSVQQLQLNEEQSQLLLIHEEKTEKKRRHKSNRRLSSPVDVGLLCVAVRCNKHQSPTNGILFFYCNLPRGGEGMTTGSQMLTRSNVLVMAAAPVDVVRNSPLC